MSDLGTFSIRVVDEDGNGVNGATVACHYDAGGVGTEYTDSDGWANFPIHGGMSGSATVILKVWVNGEEVSDGFDPSDGDTFSFVLP